MREGQVWCDDCQTGHTPSLVNGTIAVACDHQLPDKGRAKAIEAGAAVTGSANPVPVDQVAVAVDRLGDKIGAQVAAAIAAAFAADKGAA